jgi:protein-disulfide isomerase
VFAIAAVALVIAAAPNLASKAYAADAAEFEESVRKLLLEKPEIVIDAIRTYQAREEEAKAERQRQQLAASKDAINGNPEDPVMGNPDGKITVVEFFDYRCGYCKRALQTVLDLVKRNPDVRVVFKEFPILGPESMVATRVSLAVQKVAPQHYSAFHTKALSHRGALNQESLLKIATEVGADAASVENAMKDPSIAKAIKANYNLAESLGIRGTPAFIIGGEVVPGAVSLDELERLVKQERG